MARRSSRARSLVRRRVLQAFGERVRRTGIRGVGMAEVARAAGISTRTLYQVFPGKAPLVEVLVAEWTADLEAGQEERMAASDDPRTRILGAAETWLGASERFSPVFWEELRRDHPEAHAAHAAAIARQVERARAWLLPRMRPGLEPRLAFTTLLAMVQRAAEPARSEQLGLTRREALQQTIGIWVRGALRPPLGIVPGGGRTRAPEGGDAA